MPVAVVTEKITDTTGKVILDSKCWDAKSANNKEIPEGELVVVEN